MPATIFDTRQANAVGVYQPASATKWPEGGAAVQASLNQGAAVVRLQVWNDPTSVEEIVEFTLPIPIGEPNAGLMHDGVHVPAPWKDFSWRVVSISGGGTLTLSVNGPAL